MVHRLIKSCRYSRWDWWLLSLNCTEKMAFRRILENHWYFSRVKYKQGKLRLYTTLKERPGFETYLTLNNPKLRQAITKLRISAHKLPIETGRYDQKTQTERICPLCCEGIGNVTHYIFECKNKEMMKVSYGCIYIYLYLLKFYVNFSKTFVYRFWFVSVIKIAMCFKFAVELQTFENIRL